jgi:3-hydroxyisobutyrate dehydrogenase-like beta-hydroxyacid dehydrogenase
MAKVAFIGLGVIGFPMAGHLRTKGHEVTVYNRSPEKAAAWRERFGGGTAATPREAAAGAGLVFACVGNDDDLRAVAYGEAISKGAAQSWQMENRWQTMAAGRFDFGFAVDWMRKDLAIVLDEARRNGAALPVTALVDQLYRLIQAKGGSRLDTSSLILNLREP